MTRPLLLLAILLSFLLFFYRLGVVPSGLVRDEAALGFNAFTLLKTAADEHGKFLPMNLESFGDWKLPGYSYLLVPFISLLGISSFSVRLLSALAGIIGVMGIYLLAEKLANKKIALITGLIFAVIPWHMHFSRAAYEANLALTFFIFGLYFFERFKSNLGILLTGLFFLLTEMTYHSAHVFLPLFWLFLIFTERRRLFRRFSTITSTILVTTLILSFVGISLFGNATKIGGIGIFSDKLAVYLNVELPRNAWGNSLISKIVFNKPTYIASTFGKNFIAFFSPSFLVTSGGQNPQHNLPSSGNLGWPMYALFLLGLIVIIIRSGDRTSRILLVMIIIGLIPSSITKDAPHYTRSIFALPAIVMAISIAILTISRISRVTGLIVTVILAMGVFLFSQKYFREFPDTGRLIWSRDLVSAMSVGITNEPKYDGIVIPRPDYSPYIFLAFKKPWNPSTYQMDVEYYPVTVEGFRHVKKLGKFSFPERINTFPFKQGKKYLIIDWRNRVEDYQGKDVSSHFTKNDLFKFVER